MRNIGNIIDQMLEVIPESEGSFRAVLTKLAQDSCYKAPEQARDCFIELGQSLVLYMGFPPDCDWKQRVADIFEDRGEWRVFRINDCEWWVARSLTDAINAAVREYDLPYEEVISEPYELDSAKLDSCKYYTTESRKGPFISFRERLAEIVAGGPKVGLFATTEF